MNDPHRLREECDGLERALLEAGVAYPSTEAARTKTLAALGLAGSAAVSIGALSVASSSIFSKLGWTKLVAISTLGAAAAVPAGYYTWQKVHQLSPKVVTAPALPTVERRAAPASVGQEEPAAAVPESLDSLPVEAPKAQPTPRNDPRSASQSALTAELAALDGVRSRLGAGDAGGALSLLDDYSRTYPRGRLALEAEVLRIDALSRNGQRAAAAKRAETFLKRHPNSVLASRVRGYLGQ